MLRRRTMVIGGSAFILTAMGGWAAYSSVRPYHPGSPPDIAGMRFPLYDEQKVVYHVTFSGGFRNRNYRNLLQVARNHLNAVGEGFLDLRILMQGDGLDLLLAAKSYPDLARQIDQLKKCGVRFELCWNTVTSKGIDPALELHGVKPEDFVGSAVAEVAALAQKGFVVIKL